MSFLAIDIGNTRLKWGLYDAAKPGARLLAHGAVFLETIEQLAERLVALLRGESDMPADATAAQVRQVARLPHPTAMLGCAVAGDAVRRRTEEQLELWDLTPHWVVSQPVGGGIVNGYDHPSRLGSDRWVAMVGARERILEQTGPGARPVPAIVVMVGTAVTVDAVDPDGCFIGGLILPGFGLMPPACGCRPATCASSPPTPATR